MGGGKGEERRGEGRGGKGETSRFPLGIYSVTMANSPVGGRGEGEGEEKKEC